MTELLPIFFSLGILGYGLGTRKWTNRRTFSWVTIISGIALTLITSSFFVMVHFSEYFNPSLHDVIQGETHYNAAVNHHNAKEASMAVRSFKEAYQFDLKHHANNTTELQEDQRSIKRSQTLLRHLLAQH